MPPIYVCERLVLHLVERQSPPLRIDLVRLGKEIARSIPDLGDLTEEQYRTLGKLWQRDNTVRQLP
jgi:hypothetical protein